MSTTSSTAPLYSAGVARLLALLLTITLVAAACGSDDGDDTTAGTSADGAADTPSDTSSSDEAEMDEMDEMAMDDDEHGHDHDHDHSDVIEVPEGMTIPSIDIRLEPDPKAGVNLFVDVADFEIAPLAASTEAVDGQGHLHLYVDGERIGRFYNTAMHLDLEPGDHEVTVEISANNHSPYAVDGEPIVATDTITVPEIEGGHSHGDGETFEATGDAPTLAVEVFEDPKSGWNLQLLTTDFTFAPEAASTEAVEGEGHAHLYIDGVKQGRIYGEWWHLGDLPEGDHEITVELSANDHRPYGVDGEPITATVTVTGTGDDGHDSDGHGGDGDEMDDSGDPEAAGADGTVIEASVTGDEVDTASTRYEVPLGATVTIAVSSDRDEHVHLHGYDLLADIAAGSTGEITFEADIPGTFEVELEDSALFLFEVTVTP